MAEEVVKLKHPIPWGEEVITELRLKPCARAFRGFEQQVKADGSIVYAPYELARVAIRMGGHPDSVADRLDPADMNALAQVALRFLGSGLSTGT